MAANAEAVTPGRMRKGRGIPQPRALLRWAGSKRAILDKLERCLPTEVGRYLEPFAGSACLFFRIQPKNAVIADLNQDLIRTYRAVKAAPKDVSDSLARLPFGRTSYYEIRSLDPATLSEADHAARFIYLNRFCFNGLYRTNRSGQFNVPFGAPRNNDLPCREEINLCSKALRNASLSAGDFEDVVRSNLLPGDLVYLDPPYFQTEGRVFRQYNPKPFLRKDLERLAGLLDYIHASGAAFLLSYAENAEAAEFFNKWHPIVIEIQRNISGFSGHRGKAREIVATNAKTLVG